MAQSLPAVPQYRLRIDVLGPIRLWRDGVAVEHPELRRQRVRELLCYLVVHRRARREAVGEELWPDVADPGQNLRVTLNYLQTVLQPERARDDRPYFLRAGGTWLELAVDERLEIDAWHLEARLDEADAAEPKRRGGRRARRLPGRAAAVARRAVPGRPVPRAGRRLSGPVAHALTSRRRSAQASSSSPHPRYANARRAAEQALIADRRQSRYRLLAHAHLANHDQSNARAALESCRVRPGRPGCRTRRRDHLLATLSPP